MIEKGTSKAELLQQCSLIIWDELPMQHRHVAEAVDRTLKDILNQPDHPFGGITVAWRGDFQQTLLVVPKGSMEEIVAACIQRSPLWHPYVTVLHLTENMCVDRSNPDSVQFANWLLVLGCWTWQGPAIGSLLHYSSSYEVGACHLACPYFGDLSQSPGWSYSARCPLPGEVYPLCKECQG